MTDYNTEKNVYVIVHGQKQFFEAIKSKLSNFGFKTGKLIPADMDKPGNPGDYVAMIWPPMTPKEIIFSEILDFNGEGGLGMGTWTSLNKKELTRIPLN
ncbi:MAG: hypothetical protein M3Z01_09645 [Thermoproteota archaeon]|nr:hypothetical protein [Thermoproteota archaeon]